VAPLVFLQYDAQQKSLSALVAGNPAFVVKTYRGLDEAISYVDAYFKTILPGK